MKRIFLTLSIVFGAFLSSFAQWTTGTTNVNNTNSGWLGINTSLYVTSGGFLYGSLTAGSVVIGQGPSMGVYFPTPSTTSWQHFIKIDQTNNDIILSNGNSDGGGGVQRPGINTGETRFFTLNGYNTGTFMTFWENSGEIARFDGSGNFLIGTTANSGGYKLEINGKAVATSMTVEVYPFADYVFNKDYRLPSLTEVKSYIDLNHHLPEIPSEAEIKKDGMNLGEMNRLLVKKVEELTLYMIEKEKIEKEDQAKITAQQKQLDALEQKLNELSKKVDQNQK